MGFRTYLFADGTILEKGRREERVPLTDKSLRRIRGAKWPLYIQKKKLISYNSNIKKMLNTDGIRLEISF